MTDRRIPMTGPEAGKFLAEWMAYEHEQVCVCMQLMSQPNKQWFVWSMRRRNVDRFVSRMMEAHNMRLRAIVRIKRA